MDDDLLSRLDTIEGLLVTHIKDSRDKDTEVAHWHVKKEVTVAHILSTLGVLALLIVSWFTLTSTVQAIDTRTLNITEARIGSVEQHVDTLEVFMRDNVSTINTSLTGINTKLGELAERTVENRK